MLMAVNENQTYPKQDRANGWDCLSLDQLVLINLLACASTFSIISLIRARNTGKMDDCSTWKSDPHCRSLWRTVARGMDSHWRSLWRAVSCGRDPTLEQGEDSSP